MVYVVNGVTGDKWEFITIDDAVKFIREREEIDRDGVVRGDYTIDDMDEVDRG